MISINNFEELFYYSHTKALFLLIIFIVFGRSFIVNLKNKKNDWKKKAWLNGIVTSISFIVLVFMPLENKSYIF